MRPEKELVSSAEKLEIIVKNRQEQIVKEKSEKKKLKGIVLYSSNFCSYLFRKRKRLEEEEEKKARRLKERAEREYKDKEYDWIDHEKTRERDKKRAEQESTEKQIKRKQALLLDDEDDKSRRRAIRQTRKQRGYERDDDRHDRAREIHEQEQSRKQREREEQRVREEAQRKADRSSQVHLEPDQDRMQLDNEHTSQGTFVRFNFDLTCSQGTRIKSPIGQGQFKEQVQVVAQPEKPTSGFSVHLLFLSS